MAFESCILSPFAAVVTLSKETTLKENVMVSKYSGLPVEVDTSSFKVEGNAFRSRDDDDGIPLETASATSVHEASTIFSDDYLSTVESLQIATPQGGSAVLKVQGFARTKPFGGAPGKVSWLTTAGYVDFYGDSRIEVDAEVEKFLEHAGKGSLLPPTAPQQPHLPSPAPFPYHPWPFGALIALSRTLIELPIYLAQSFACQTVGSLSCFPHSASSDGDDDDDDVAASASGHAIYRSVRGGKRGAPAGLGWSGAAQAPPRWANFQRRDVPVLQDPHREGLRNHGQRHLEHRR